MENADKQAVLNKQVAAWRSEVARLQDLIAHAVGAPAVTVDMPEFRRFLNAWWHAKDSVDILLAFNALIAHIDAWQRAVTERAEKAAYERGYDDGHIAGREKQPATEPAQPAGELPPLPDVLRALQDARALAMKNAAEARLPECGDFAAIAQNLDYVVNVIGAYGRQCRAAGIEAAAKVVAPFVGRIIDARATLSAIRALTK